MAYTHLTTCVPVDHRKSLAQALVEGGLTWAAVGALLGSLGGGWGALLGAFAALPYGIVTAFCDWFFHFRLICIQDNQCAVGTIGRIEISRDFLDPDGDFNINLVLAPVAITSLLNASAQLALPLPPTHARYLTKFFDGSSSGQPDLPWRPDIKSTLSEDDVNAGEKGTTALHCEIEGTRMMTICTATKVATFLGSVVGFLLGAAVLAACAASGVFFLLCLLLAIVVALLVTGVIGLAGYGIGYAAGSEGSPEDVATDPDSGTVEVGDCIAMIGDWIYDSGHDGWHELHPVKGLLRLQRKDEQSKHAHKKDDQSKTDPCLTMTEARIKKICSMVRSREDPVTKQAQGLAANQWLTHPRVG